MPAPRRIASPLLAILLTGLLASDRAGIARAQPGAFVPNTHFELSDTVQVDRADNVVRGNLERAKAYLAARQWSEAIETYRQVMENSGAMLVGVTVKTISMIENTADGGKVDGRRRNIVLRIRQRLEDEFDIEFLFPDEWTAGGVRIRKAV